MKNRYLAFDIETAKVLPEIVNDLKAYRPLGISCAAVLAEGDERPHLWYSCDSNGQPCPQMSRDDLSELVDFLKSQVSDGFEIVTWNGLGFDFDILSEESGRVEDCRKLAIDHIDMMFHVFCENGFAVSLEAAAKAIGPYSKPAGMNATIAPTLWASGKTDTVLEYLSNDCRMTLEVAMVSLLKKSFRWIAHSGNSRDFDLRSGWLSVREAMLLPQPDTSWMTSPPWPRSKFTAWLHMFDK